MSSINHTPARTLDPHHQALWLLCWSSEEAGEQREHDQVESFEVSVDEENNSEAWWSALDAEYPELGAALRKGSVTMTPEQLAVLTLLPGFDEGPEHAPYPILWTSTWGMSDEEICEACV